jgi:hypothetical protein
VNPRALLAASALTTAAGLLASGTVGGALAGWILLIGWISFIFALHRFGRQG